MHTFLLSDIPVEDNMRII